MACRRCGYSGAAVPCPACFPGRSAINTQPAINEERLTDAINTPDSAINVAVDRTSSGARDCVEHGAPRHLARGRRAADGGLSVRDVREGGHDQRTAEILRTPNRRNREDYNAYMKTYMAAYRERSAK